VTILEDYVRRYPTQWYCFYPFWDDPSRKESPGAAAPRPPRRASRGLAAPGPPR
jgi:hypothetical protein